LQQLAQDADAYVYASIAVLPDAEGSAGDGLARNRALVFGPEGDELTRYDKVHPFTYGRESEHFAGGDCVRAFAWGAADRGVTVSPSVCYDLRFPELYRAGLELGAEVFVLGANWPEPRTMHWRQLAIARAIENQAYVLATNRCGRGPHLGYAGNSIAVAPTGDVLAEAGDEPTTLSVEVEADVVRRWRDEFPAWKDRSPALAQWMREHLPGT
jgi:predicted amidohydrolase